MEEERKEWGMNKGIGGGFKKEEMSSEEREID